MRHTTPLIALAALLATALPALTRASGPQLKLPAFDHLQQIATDSVNLSIGPWPLSFISGLVDKDDDPKDAQFRQVMHGLKGIYIRSFEFAADHMYSSADVEAVREQLAGAGWSPITQVRNRDDDEKVDIYVCMSHEAITGLAVIASGKRKFTIVNLVGSLDPQKLAAIGDRFGVPELAR